MGNLFIGFPVPRAKIADMITGSAPPLNHVANHEPDGSDPLVLPGDIDPGEFVGWNGTKFIGAAAGGNGGFPSPITIHPAQFIAPDDTIDYSCSLAGLQKRTEISSQVYYAPVNLPHGVSVTKLTVFAYLNHVDTKCWVTLYRVSNVGGVTGMAAVFGEWVDGDNSEYDDSISEPVIDNVNYSYGLNCVLDPYNVGSSAILRRIIIDFT